MKFKDNYEELQKVMTEPDKILPTLSKDEIRLLLIQTILAYIERKIPFRTVVTIVKLIKQYSPAILPQSIDRALKDISELERHHELIEELLTDTLQELTKVNK